MDRISDTLRSQIADLGEIYARAKADEDGGGPLLERLAKSISGLAKQLREQEQYERSTVPLAEIHQKAVMLADVVAGIMKSRLGGDANDEIAKLAEFIQDNFT